MLLREKDWPEETFGKGFEEMCFASHLLGEFGPKKKYVLTQSKFYPLILVSRATRLYTRVVLIDFHQAEDRSVKSTEHTRERGG